MARIPFGNLGDPLRAGQFVQARNIRGGVISAQEIIIAGGTQGVIRSQNFVPDPLVGWAIYGDGSAYFGANVQIGGDVYSANWNGSVPANLATRDTGATAGYYLDASVGSAQLMGDLFMGGSITLSGSGKFRTAASGDRVEIDAATGFIALFDAVSGKVGQIGWAATGFGSNDLVIENQSGLGDIELHAAGLIELDADGSTAIGVHISNGSPAGGIPSYPLVVEGGSGEGFVISNGTVDWAFETDRDTGIRRFGANDIAIVTGGTDSLRIDANNRIRMASNGTNSNPTLGWVDNTSGTGFQLVTISSGEFRAVSNANTIWDVLTSGGVPLFESAAIDNLTTGSGANMHIGTGNNQMRRSTSSLRYKPGWQFADEEALAALEMPVPIVWLEHHEFDDESNDDDPVVNQDLNLGFATEHVFEMLPAATQDLREGGPELYDPRSLIAILSAKAKVSARKVKTLEQRVDALEAIIAKLPAGVLK